MVMASLTAVSGCLSRSVRDIARFFDVSNGFDPRDPYSLPRVDGWETGLGSHLESLRGKRAAISVDLGRASVANEVREVVEDAARWLADEVGFELVTIPIRVPEVSYEWALSGLGEILMRLGDKWPDCKPDLTPQIAFGMEMAQSMYSIETRARIESQRVRMNETMAAIFDQVDFVLASTNPDVAFGSHGPMPEEIDGERVGLGNNGALTIPANIYGSPAISIPAGQVRGLPVGLQVLAPHHREEWLLDCALAFERARPWPLTAPGSPA
jgi:aspartyl-tRNA(Asn)/glutamyl-tRNA(Gln) amidotransferase subunit A